VLALSGCPALLVGGRCRKGRYEASYAYPLDQVYEATQASLNEMDMGVRSAQLQEGSATLSAQRADGTGISIDLTRTGARATLVGIRVGTLGDKQASETIAEHIGAKLGQGAPKP
jgi:hypothetical protein